MPDNGIKHEEMEWSFNRGSSYSTSWKAWEVGWSLEQALEGSGHSTKSASSRIIWKTLLAIWFSLGSPAKSRKLDSMSLKGPFQCGIFGFGQWSVHLEPAGIGSVRHRRSFWQLLLCHPCSTPATNTLPCKPNKIGSLN